MVRLKDSVDTLVSLGLPASGAGVTLHFLLGGQVGPAVVSGITTVGVAVLTLGRRFGKRVWARLGDRVDEQADSFADWLFDQSKRWGKRTWWMLSGNFREKYNRSLIYRYRDYQTQGLTTRGPFALDLEKLFVPLRLRPESIGQISGDLVGRPDAGGSWNIWQFLVALKTQSAFDRLVILGGPGSGKTTLLEHVALIFAKGTHKRYSRQLQSYVPVLICLREVRDLITADKPASLQSLIEQQLQIDGITPPPNWFQEMLQQGKCLIMIDGLDEVSSLKQRRKVSQWVTQQMRLHRENPFIITSRPFGYRDAPLEGATTLDIKPFNLSQMQQFIRSWYLQTETVRHLGKADRGVKKTAQTQSEDLIRRIQNNPSLAAMALNPLLLTMIATVHAYRGALPGKRVELYSEICDVLLGRRQDMKGIPDILTADQKKKVLQTLAFKLMKRRTRTFRLFAGKVLIEKQLAEVAKGEISAEEFIQHIEQTSGLLVERHPGVYEFAHKSLQEYLAAVQVRVLNREYELTRNIDDPWWEETIRLYAAQNDSSNLIWAALQQNSVKALSVAYDCLEEAESVSKDVRNDLEGRLGAGLESSKPEIFKLAAEVKLERRLKRLLRLDEKTDIDLTYISCAEYQLFLDELAEEAKTGAFPNQQFRQPDHWKEHRFPHGSAKAAIAGLRASDAQAFCDWLTQRINSLGSIYLEAGVTVVAGPVRVRLPSAQELRDHPVSSPHADKLSSWYNNSSGATRTVDLTRTGDRMAVELMVEQPPAIRVPGATEEDEGGPDETRFGRKSKRHSPLAAQLIEQIVQDTSLIFDPILRHVLTLNNVLIYDSVDDVLSQALDVQKDPLRTLERDTALSNVRGLALSGRDGAELSRDRDLILRLAEEWGKEVEQKAIAALNRNPKLHQKLSGNKPLLPAPEILMVCAFWRMLAEFYDTLSKKRRLVRQNAIIPEDCKRWRRQYLDHCEDVLRFYVFLALKDERRLGRAEAWESLRIVRATRS